MTQLEYRAAIVAEARTWLGTKYVHRAKVKGHGADCMTLIVAVAESVGLVKDLDIPAYSPQFNLHRSAETYLDGLLKYCREVSTPQPGDIVIYRFGRVFAHAGIVADWPTIIHAHIGSGVLIENGEAGWLSFVDDKGAGIVPRPRKFLSYW